MDHINGRLQVVGVDAVRECPPVGVYALATLLEEAGHVVAIADMVQSGTNQLLQLTSSPDAFDLIGISATSMAWPTAVDVISQIRRLGCKVPIVCGGIHPSLFDIHILTSFPVDFVIRGEGETPLLRLCEVISGHGSLDSVPSLTWRNKAGELVQNPEKQRFSKQEIGELPLPDYSRLEPGAYKCLAIESSRGCAFDCVFCSTPYRKSWRAISPEVFVDRLETVMQHIDRVRTGCIHIVDDEFALNPRRAMAIADCMHERGLSPQLLYDARAPDVVAPGFLERFAGLTAGMLIGAECGYDEGLLRVGKGITCQSLKDAAAALAKAGIADRVDFSFIMGLPWETLAEVEKTIRFATQLHADYGVHIMLQWYRQIPGSNLWADAERDQKVTAAMYDNYGFFGDYYLLTTACKLSAREMYKVGDHLDRVGWLAGLHGRSRPSIVHALPAALTDYFPRHLLNTQNPTSANLPLEGIRP